MTRVTTDVDAVNELFTSGVVTVFGDLFTLFGIMGVMVWMNWRLALVTFAVIPLFFVVTNWFRRGSRTSFREVRKWIARINAFLQENITGMSVVQLFRREERNVAAFAEINRKHADANMDQIFYYAVFYPAIELLAAVATALILLYGGSGVLTGALSLGALVAFVQYSERFWRPISDLSEKFNILQQAMASSERIFALLDTPLEVQAPAQPVRLGEVQGRIGFESVSFAYDTPEAGQPQWVLQDIDFAVAAREERGPGGRHGRRARPRSSACSPGSTTCSAGRVTLDGVDVRDLDPVAAALVAGPRAAGRPPVQRHHRLQHPARLGDPRRARARGGAGRPCPSLHRGPAPGLRDRGEGARGHAVRGPEAAPVASPARWPTIPGC